MKVLALRPAITRVVLLCVLAFVTTVAQAQREGTLVSVPDDSAANRYTAAQAKDLIEQEVRRSLLFYPERRFDDFDQVQRVVIDVNTVGLVLSGRTVTIPLEIFGKGEVRRFDSEGVTVPGYGTIFPVGVFGLRERAIRLGDAFRAIYVHEGRARTQLAREEDARFDDVVAQYIGKPKPDIPEEARRSRVQAESAVKDKRFGDAAQRYGEALKVAPWWPEGHFNRALMLAELNRHAEAIRSMKRYLMLVPEATNARQAQDQIYAWEDKVSRR